jgi:hypothetical protein
VGAETAADRLADLVDEGIHDVIVGLPALGSSRHEARTQQQGEMPGHVGLTGAGRPYDLDDAAFTIPEHIQDAKAGGVGEEAQAVGHRFEELLWQFHNHKII